MTHQRIRRPPDQSTVTAVASPPAAWESLVVTGKARAAIRRATRAAVRRQYAGLGRQILDRAIERAAKTFSEDKLRGAIERRVRRQMAREILHLHRVNRQCTGNTGPWGSMDISLRRIERGEPLPDWRDLHGGEGAGHG